MNKSQIGELALLFKKRMSIFTGGDSTSVPMETAEQILLSIRYCLNGYRKMSLAQGPDKNMLLPKESVETCFQKGLKIEEGNIQAAKALLACLQSSMLTTANIAYRDTLLHGIPLFFQQYDVQFAAHLDGGSIDYPLAAPVTELSGIEAMLEYLTRLQIEADFIGSFTSEAIEALLRAYSAEYEALLVNIFELVMHNALGLQMLGKAYDTLCLTQPDAALLNSKLSRLTDKEMQATVRSSLTEVLQGMQLTDAQHVRYYEAGALSFCAQLRQRLTFGTLEGLFVCMRSSAPPQTEFLDGPMMPDEELREIISELSACRYTSDKLAMLQRCIHSVADLTEVLAECFDKEEYDQVFFLLHPAERQLLSDRIQEDLAYDACEENLKEWQLAFLRYMEVNPRDGGAAR